MNGSKYILAILAVVLPIAFISRINEIGFLFFYLIFLPVDNTNGIVLNVQRENGVQGGLSYEYLVRYKIDGKQYEFTELFSPDSLLNVNVNDSVNVKYSKVRPQYATLKNNKAHFANLGLLLILLFFEVVIVREIWKGWQQKEE